MAAKTINNRNAAWLKSQRSISGMSAADFAAALGMSRVTLWRYETRAQALPNWLAISAASIAKSAAGDVR